jgi:hypothetical protein
VVVADFSQGQIFIPMDMIYAGDVVVSHNTHQSYYMQPGGQEGTADISLEPMHINYPITIGCNFHDHYIPMKLATMGL